MALIPSPPFNFPYYDDYRPGDIYNTVQSQISPYGDITEVETINISYSVSGENHGSASGSTIIIGKVNPNLWVAIKSSPMPIVLFDETREGVKRRINSYALSTFVNG